jgi:predicted MFS family arabinose efflux permease
METRSKGRLILPALTAARISPVARALLTSFLLIEIGQTYGTSIGVTNQIKTVNSFVAIISALAMGLLSVRMKHKTLLVAGLGLSVITTLGCVVAPSFITLLIVFSLGGWAANMIFPMSTAIMGANIPREDRSKAMGWLVAGPAALYVFGFPIVNYIGDWRQAFLFFALPLILVALALTVIGVPASETVNPRTDILAGYRGVFSNRSAIASLIGNMMGMFVWQIPLSLASSYYRSHHGISRGLVVYIIMAMAIIYIGGSLVSRRIISRTGYKKATVFFAFGLSFFTIATFLDLPTTISVALGFGACLMAGLFAPSSQGLNLEQIPELRGSMMSMVSAFGSTGNMLSLGLSGLLLMQYDWSTMGIVIGIFGLIGAVIVHFLAREPSIG